MTSLLTLWWLAYWQALADRWRPKNRKASHENRTSTPTPNPGRTWT